MIVTRAIVGLVISRESENGRSNTAKVTGALHESSCIWSPSGVRAVCLRCVSFVNICHRRGRHTTDAPRSSIPRRHTASNVGNILPQGRYGGIIIRQTSSLTNTQNTALLQTSSIVHYLLTSARSLVLSILLEATIVLISIASRIDPSFWPYIVRRRACDILILSWY